MDFPWVIWVGTYQPPICEYHDQNQALGRWLSYHQPYENLIFTANEIHSAVVKKLVTIFLLIVYSGTTFGEAINFRKCGSCKSQILSFDNPYACPCKPKGIPKHRCENDLGCLQIDNIPVQEPLLLTAGPFQADLLLLTVDYPPLMSLKGSCADHLLLNSGQKYPQPIYLLIRVFRI